MKNLLAILVLSLSTSACSATTTVSESKPAEVIVEKKEVEQKEVCIRVWNAKLNTEVVKCRMIEIHKKHKGTKVPDPIKK